MRPPYLHGTFVHSFIRLSVDRLERLRQRFAGVTGVLFTIMIAAMASANENPG